MSQNRLKRSKKDKKTFKKRMCFWIQTKKDILTKLENNLSKYSHKKKRTRKKFVRLRKKERTEDALALEGEEGRD